MTMKNNFLLFFILPLLYGCYDQKSIQREAVSQYYEGFNSGKYSQIKEVISDSIIFYSGDYIMPYSSRSFHEKFKWDSIFQPSYTLVGMECVDDHIIATVQSSSVRHIFLKNSPMICDYKISFDNGKISKIEDMECPTADWDVWQREVGNLVKWVDLNHPEFNGFIYEMTMNGAINYLKVIALYEDRDEVSF